MKNIPNKDEAFAALTRNLSKLNKKGVKVFAQDGKIQFDGIPIDITEFSTVNKNKLDTFLSNLPNSRDTTSTDFSNTSNIFNSNNFKTTNILEMAQLVSHVLQGYNGSIKEMIVETLVTLLNSIEIPILEELRQMFPDLGMYTNLITLILRFFSEKASSLEEQYEKWIYTKSYEDYNPLFDYVDLDKCKRALEFMQKAIDVSFDFLVMKRHALEQLMKYFYEWFAQNYSDYVDDKNRDKKTKAHSAEENFISEKKSCKICNGVYFDSQGEKKNNKV